MCGWLGPVAVSVTMQRRGDFPLAVVIARFRALAPSPEPDWPRNVGRQDVEYDLEERPSRSRGGLKAIRTCAASLFFRRERDRSLTDEKEKEEPHTPVSVYEVRAFSASPDVYPGGRPGRRVDRCSSLRLGGEGDFDAWADDGRRTDSGPFETGPQALAWNVSADGVRKHRLCIADGRAREDGLPAVGTIAPL